MNRKANDFYLKTKGGWMTTTGSCMYPLLQEGSRIRVAPVEPESLEPLQLIVFEAKELVCHRLIKRIKLFSNYWFIHKGDKPAVGGVCSADDLIGTVAEITDKNGNKIVDTGYPEGAKKTAGLTCYFYVLMYILKRSIWGVKQNKLSRFLNAFCWRFF